MGTVPSNTLIVRADANVEIGTGHVMRCLALAQAWLDRESQVIMVMAEETPLLEALLKSEGIEIIRLSSQKESEGDAIQTARLGLQMGASWVVVDGYKFNANYQWEIKNSGLNLLFIDDYGHADHYYADLVSNQNIHAHEGLYKSREPYTQLLLGPRYILLRREFLKWRGWRRKISEVGRKILVTIGGSDPNNMTLKVIQALQQVDLPGLEAKIIVGPANPNLEILRQAVQRSVPHLQLLTTITDMPELMIWADLAVSGGGTTSWELAFMGLPSVVLVIAENQRVIAEELGKMGVFFNLGWYEQVSSSQVAQAMTRLLLSAEARTIMSSRGQGLVDGEGVDRVLMRMGGQRIRLRRVREEDGRLIWEWANDPSVRAVSFSSEPILWEEHLKWFQSKLNDPKCIFYIALNEEDVPIGQVRYDMNDGEVIVSISLGSSFRGKGYGNEIIKFSLRKPFKILEDKCIHSYVKMGNEASVKMFLEAGFKNVGETLIHGEPAVHLILPKEGVA
jgi:UDP-2,4-diacetamido-2,4,6-trideoxy-beta-L-altropyranose hydrolase